MRTATLFNEGWNYSKSAANAAEAAAAKGEAVTLPHTWNAVDGQENRD